MWKFLAGFVVAAAMGYWFVSEEQNEKMLFPRMQVMNLGDYARVSGSVVGEGKEEATGYSHWSCWKPRMACEVISLSEVGHNHVALYDPENVAVTEWTDRYITINSRSDDPNQCNYYEVKADFVTETASYTRFPKSIEGNCAMLDQRIYNWRLADSIQLKYPNDE